MYIKQVISKENILFWHLEGRVADPHSFHPDPEAEYRSGSGSNTDPDPIRIRIQSGSRALMTKN
jgi:hypothetical protein